MRRWCALLMVVALVAFLAGCNGGTKVHIEDERTIEETRPVVTGDEPVSHSTLHIDKDGKVHYEEETTTETTRPIITGD